MKRQDKYPETSAFTFYNANPKNRMGSDCVIRAICTALDQSWEQTLRELTEVGIKHGYTATSKETYKKYLAEKGFGMHKQPRKWDNTKYTGYEWCHWLCSKEDDPRYSGCKAIIAHIGGHHIVCIKPIHGVFKVHDTWDSTDGCIGNYWVIK